MSKPCGKVVPQERVPPIMRALVNWPCHRPQGHRGPCCIDVPVPPKPLRPIKTRWRFDSAIPHRANSDYLPTLTADEQPTRAEVNGIWRP